MLLLQAGALSWLPFPFSDRPWERGDYILAFLAAVAFLWFLSVVYRPNAALKSWSHYFPGMQFGSRDVYNKIAIKVKEYNIPNLRVSYPKYFEAGPFTPKREYLCFEYKIFNIDICCMSYGTGYYMSWWLGQKDPGLVSRIPVIKDIFGKNPKYQSYYQLDTATLFQSGIHSAILAVIEEITKEQGLRQLTELESQPFSRAL